jgi:hypothetical protein
VKYNDDWETSEGWMDKRMTDNPRTAFVRVLEEDAAQWEKMATSLEELIPHLVGNEQRNWAKAEVEYRRSLARRHRALIELVKLEKM